MTDSIIRLLRCPDCLKTRLEPMQDGYRCIVCERMLLKTNAMLDCRPSQGIRLPKLYQDPNLKQWDLMRKESHDYFYRSSGPLAWIQNAGHRTIAKWRRGESCAALLDLGCGDGAHLDFANGVNTYVGLDMDAASLAGLSTRRAPGVEQKYAIRGDACLLPFADQSFETVISVYNLEHLVYPDLCLEEICRVLTGDGSLYISVPNEGGWAWGLGRRHTSGKHFNSEEIDYNRLIAIEYINCIWQLEKTVKRHFRITKLSRFPFYLPTRHANLITTMRCKKPVR